MPFDYIEIEDAIAQDGLRMVVVSNVPSPWGEAAKGVFHVKGLDWSAIRLVQDSADLDKLTGGEKSGPVVIYKDEKPRSGWAEILLFAERLAPTPALLPKDPADRALAFGLAHELLGEGGLGWERRLQLAIAGMEDKGGFPKPAAQYIAGKYGHTPEAAAACDQRVVGLLGMLADRLKAQKAAGSDYYIGDALTAVDIYSATIMAMFGPLPDDKCALNPVIRNAFETMDEATQTALDPILHAHRDRIYDRYLETPLSL